MSRLFLIAGGALLVQACTVVVAGDDQQCSADVDCADRGFVNAVCAEQVCIEDEEIIVTDPVWGCLGNVEEPTPDLTKTVSFDVRLAYAVSGAAVSTDTVIDVCEKLDPNCTANSPDFPKGLNPDPNGVVELTVKEGFDGFVKITGASPDVLVDSRVYVGRPIVEIPTVEEIQLFAPIDLQALASTAMQTPDPTRGTAIVLIQDCSGDGVGGVRFETPAADSDTLEFYLINQFPTPPPEATTTDADGFGGFFNVPVGPSVMRAFRDEDDTYVGESSYQILADTISYVLVAPTPQ
ncbi:MAG: hypothetical protein RIF41_09985 [Polyangiaceae bacterium]